MAIQASQRYQNPFMQGPAEIKEYRAKDKGRGYYKFPWRPGVSFRCLNKHASWSYVRVGAVFDKPLTDEDLSATTIYEESDAVREGVAALNRQRQQQIDDAAKSGELTATKLTDINNKISAQIVALRKQDVEDVRDKLDAVDNQIKNINPRSNK